MTDEFTRQSLALEVGRSFKSECVCQVCLSGVSVRCVCQALEELFAECGTPAALRMDNGPEFIALALRGLCHRRQINAAYIEPGKPWHTPLRCGGAEWICGKFSCATGLRDEFLDGEVFVSVLDAQVRLRVWRR